jgi:putative DNA primase/helicase
MTLIEAIMAAGMTPPRQITEGRWLRFPGAGKGRSNRSGWCRVICPTLALFGDWSTGLTVEWRDQKHEDDERSRWAMEQARKRQREFAEHERARQRESADKARAMLNQATTSTHPYLARKGFPALSGLTLEGKLIVPVMDFERYPDVISAQLIDEQGDKKFLPGGRAKGGVYRLGVPTEKARRVVLCEGYATGLSLDAALRMLPGPYCVIVCFSARNLETVSELLKCDALVAADNDASHTGEQSAKRTGRRWIMPGTVGTDFNDLHTSQGLRAVVEAIRTA